jgi:two-component system chemotaxis response regulator CheB
MFEVLIVDDSAVMRRILTDMINKIDDFRVIDTAVDAYDAREKIKQYEPDLITLDINMPKMDGVMFLKNLMRLHPMPTVIVSSESARGSEAFDDGAIGFVPKQSDSESSHDFFERLEDTLLSLTFMFQKYHDKKVKPKKRAVIATPTEIEKKYHPDDLLPKSPYSKNALKVIAIGSSTGGVEALLTIFKELPDNLPPIVITQHIPYGFSSSFAKRLNQESKVNVKEVQGGEVLQSSHAYLAPGNQHMIFRPNGDDYVVELLDGIKISRHKPSVDIMFRSVSNEFGNRAMGIMLTGMGDDGSIGIKELKDNGGFTVAQSERSCVVYGMPKKANEAGGVVKSDVDLDAIASEMIAFGNKR